MYCDRHVLIFLSLFLDIMSNLRHVFSSQDISLSALVFFLVRGPPVVFISRFPLSPIPQAVVFLFGPIPQFVAVDRRNLLRF